MIAASSVQQVRRESSLEGAIHDVRGDALLVVLAMEGCTDQGCEAWEIYHLKRPSEGHHLLMWTSDQFDGFVHACYRVLQSARELERVFHGPDEAQPL